MGAAAPAREATVAAAALAAALAPPAMRREEERRAEEDMMLILIKERYNVGVVLGIYVIYFHNEVEMQQNDAGHPNKILDFGLQQQLRKLS